MFPPLSPLSQPGAGAPGQQPDMLPPAAGGAPGLIASQSAFSDTQLLDMFKRWKKESFDQRWIFERQWMRNVWYVLNRQWIYYDTKAGRWQDKRLAKWIPRPVTNVTGDAIKAVRASFARINYGTNARPLGDDQKNMITADLVDDFAPVLHEDYQMDSVMSEFDFWTLTTGNAWLHTFVDYDRANGMIDDAHETCVNCQQDFPGSMIAQAGQVCPNCQGTAFMPTLDQAGDPVIDQTPLPKGMTLPLSPFEIAYPLHYERYSIAPYTIRMRWRDKSHYEQNEELRGLVNKLPFGKTPTDRSMQIFKTLPFQNDLGVAAPFFAGGGGTADAEGIVEYDVWVKPCADFPDGQVIRFAGDTDTQVIHSEKESLPGPLPYHDVKGNPRFTFHHARYAHVGGRSLGSALIDPIIGKQDQLNQLDSHMLMIIGRMANPVWLEPKGAEVEKFTGEPGLVVKWNPLVAGGTAKPERVPGEGINASVFEYRGIIKSEIEELSGTNDVLKGQKPAGVEAFASLNFLDEKAQGRHASAFKERGAAYKGWFGDALEIEREFGPDQRLHAMMMPSRGWAFREFKKADLGGAITVMIEDGTLAPKTSLGERASIEHLRQLGLLNPSDPDQIMAIFEKFGQSRLLPSLDAQVQEAWMNMDKFEKFLNDPKAIQAAAQQAAAQPVIPGQPAPMPGPLQYKRWYNAPIHRQESIKWALSDRGRAAFMKSPAAEQLFTAYLTTIDLAIAQTQMGMLDAGGVMINTQPPAGAGGGKPATGAPAAPGAPAEGHAPGGPGTSMGNSNQNAAGAGPNSSSGIAAAAQPIPQQIAPTERALNFLEHK